MSMDYGRCLQVQGLYYICAVKVTSYVILEAGDKFCHVVLNSSFSLSCKSGFFNIIQ